MSPPTLHPTIALALSASLALAACKASPAEPTPDKPSPTTPSMPAGDQGAKANRGGDHTPSGTTPEPPRSPPRRKVVARPTASVEPAPDDPLKGKFTLEDATKGLPPGKQLLATIETSMGKIECKLFDDKAPITVANFVGLARGVRPWKTPEGKWEKKPAYEGTTFHRIIKGFMIQGGDPKKNGSGEPG